MDIKSLGDKQCLKDSLKSEALDKCEQTLGAQKDTISLIVTGHLFVEYWLEWLLRASMPRPEKLLDSVNFTFVQKLALAESLGLVKSDLADAARRLNAIRNKVAHNLDYRISADDIKVLASFSSVPDRLQAMQNLIGTPKAELTHFCLFFAGYAAASALESKDLGARPINGKS